MWTTRQVLRVPDSPLVGGRKVCGSYPRWIWVARDVHCAAGCDPSHLSWAKRECTVNGLIFMVLRWVK